MSDKFKRQEPSILNNVPSRNRLDKIEEVPSVKQEKIDPSAVVTQAGKAAISRLGKKNKHSGSPSSRMKNSKENQPTYSNTSESIAKSLSEKDSKEAFAVQGVYFKCPLLGPDILTKEEWKCNIRNYLEEKLVTEKCLASCLMIQTLNQISVAKNCVEVLCTIINNILLYPKEEKYRKIRVTNKIFEEKISKVVGAMEFIESVGFVKKSLPSDSKLEDYYVCENPDVPLLQRMVKLLSNTKPINLELHRNVKVLKPAQLLQKVQLPDEFYVRTKEDIKLEQLRRTESLENSRQLKTKEMREKERQKNVINYRYTLVRIRFPDGLCLQGTFGVFEKLSDVKYFVRSFVTKSVKSFSLTTPLGVQIPECDDEKTLEELKLVPAVLLTFVPNKALPAGQTYFVPGLKN